MAHGMLPRASSSDETPSVDGSLSAGGIKRYAEAAMSQTRWPEPTPNLKRVAGRLEAAVDLNDRGIADTPRPAYPLAALLLGSAADGADADAVTVAAAIELIDTAVIEHYYQCSRPIGERLLAGDYRYALGMGLVAELRRGELVAALARATSDIARGHATQTGDERVGLRSSLWPAAVELAALLSRARPDEARLRWAGVIGGGREAVLMELDGACPNLGRLVASLPTVFESGVPSADLTYLAQVMEVWATP